MSDLYYIVQCKLCPKKFEVRGVPTPSDPSQPVDAATMKIVQGLAAHMGQKHKEQLAAIMMNSQTLVGAECLHCFDIQDPGLTARIEHVRHQIFKRYQIRYLTDENLAEIIHKVFDADVGYRLAEIPIHEDSQVSEYSSVLRICQHIRDYHIEVDPVPTEPTEPRIRARGRARKEDWEDH